MTVDEIATHLVKLCRDRKFAEAQKRLFARNAISIEPRETPVFQKETHGLDAILEKGEKWDSMVKQFHNCMVSEPLVAGDVFAVLIALDITMVERGRMLFREIAVYSVKDGKIVSEQFFS